MMTANPARMFHGDPPCRPWGRPQQVADAMEPVVIVAPEPCWRRRLERLLLAAAFALTAAVFFRLGQRFPDLPPAGPPPVPVAALPAPPVVDAAPAAPTAVPPAAADGLAFEDFSFRQEGPRLGRYRFTAVNGGREFRGTLQFLIEGEPAADGKQPPAARTVDGTARLRIRQRLSSQGAVPLEEGVPIRRVEIRLIEDGTVRARHAVVLAGN